MGEQNRNYYRARAEQELTAASQAKDPTSESIHKALARRYQKMAEDIPEESNQTGILRAAE